MDDEKKHYKPFADPFAYGVFGPFKPVDLKVETLAGLRTQIVITAVAATLIDDPKVWDQLKELFCQPRTRNKSEPPSNPAE